MGMKLKTVILPTLLGLAMLASPAAIGDADAARAHLLAGDYDAAIETSLQPQTTAGFIVAAETVSAQVMLDLVPDVNKSAKVAKGYAQNALDAEPDNTEALIQYALALGFEARSSGIMKAYFGKLPQKSKAAIDVAYTAAPNDPRTSALLGAWHLGIVRKAGEKRAQKMFGANLEDGMSAYAAAAAAAPNDIVIAGNYAITLLGIDPVAHKDTAQALLVAIKNTPPKNAVEGEVKRRMVPLIEFLEYPDAMKFAVENLMNDPEE